MSVLVEIAIEDAAGLEVAARGGADRVELCMDLGRGGLTPPPELVQEITERAAALVTAREAKPHFDVHTLIRSHAGTGDFLGQPAEFAYDAAQVQLMAEQAQQCVAAGAAGVVIGALTESGELDLSSVRTIRDAALGAATDALRGVHLTFHRALDALPSREARVEAVRTLLGEGFHRVLSSGGAPRALDGAADLRAMVEAAEELLDVCAGGGVRPADLRELVERSAVADIHLSARSSAAASTTTVPAAAPPTRTDPAIVAAVVDIAGEL